MLSVLNRPVASEYMQWGGGVDFNTLITTGFYQHIGINANTPYGDVECHFQILVLTHTVDWVRQFAWDVRGNNMFTRGKYGGIWSGWTSVFNDGQQGSWLNQNATLVYGASGLNYFNASLPAGAEPNINNAPNAEWWHIIRCNHPNANGYYTDLALPFHMDHIWYKQVVNGANRNGRWIQVLDDYNFNQVCQSKAIVTYIELTAQSQEIPLGHISADQAVQLVISVPTVASQKAYMDCGMRCSNQYAGGLTFTADSTPSATLGVYVVVYNL